MKIRNIVLISSSISLAVAGFVGLTIGSINSKAVNAVEPNLIITNNSEFETFRNNVNTGTSYEGELIRLDADVEITLTSKPSSTEESGYCTFKGTFDGNGHTIDITINTSDSAVGLFRNQNGTFKNTNITGTIVNSGQYASPLAVYNNGTIQNVNSSITADLSVESVSGIVFRNQTSGKILDCSFSGDLKGTSKVGGICSDAQKGTISGCINTGSITAKTGKYAGGILSVLGSISSNVGTNVLVTKCINKGTVTSVSDVGGITGFAYPNSKITYCSNYGSVTSTEENDGIGTGGIVGRIRNKDTTGTAITLIQYCYNAGNITANRLVGGLIGLIASQTSPKVEVKNNFSTGNVTATRSSGNANAGTLIGFVNTEQLDLDDSWATGTYSVQPGVTASTYGYGIGGGTARSDASSKAEGVSDAFREVVQFIREYNCEEDVSSFKTKFEGLSSDEKTLLGEVNYYDENTAFVQRTYKGAAEYIIGHDDSGSLLGFKAISDNEESKLFIIIAVVTLISSITTVGFVVLKRKKAR